MSRLILQSDDRSIEVELTTDDEDGQIIATCVKDARDEGCTWTERYDDLGDASEYATDHFRETS
jgi:hypothetical protein